MSEVPLQVVPAVRKKGDARSLEKLGLKSVPFFYCEEARPASFFFCITLEPRVD